MLREALSHQFQRSLPEYLDGMITVVSVKMSPDIRIAKIYISIYRSTTDPDILIKRLNTHAPEIRKELAGHVSMKFMPELRFYRDDTLDAAERIEKLLQAVRREDEARGLHHDSSDGDAEASGRGDEDGSPD
ncbi:MAG: ribosome-binding factor [Chlorobi bacterium]|nr:ribosome-binding factor [Chlorobiota bacterium]